EAAVETSVYLVYIGGLAGIGIRSNSRIRFPPSLGGVPFRLALIKCGGLLSFHNVLSPQDMRLVYYHGGARQLSEARINLFGRERPGQQKKSNGQGRRQHASGYDSTLPDD